VKIEICERQAVRVACMRYTGPFGEPLVKFWRHKVYPWLGDLGLLDCPRYGVPLDNPMSTPPAECRYDACVELPRGLTLPDVQETTIAGGRYAVTRFKGTGAEIGPVWNAFVSVALARITERVDAARRPYEHYPRGATVDTKTGMFSCELHLPVT
jgi:AraC family transcriptional regulator